MNTTTTTTIVAQDVDTLVRSAVALYTGDPKAIVPSDIRDGIQILHDIADDLEYLGLDADQVRKATLRLSISLADAMDQWDRRGLALDLIRAGQAAGDVLGTKPGIC